MPDKKGLNILMISIHGLIRANNMELGRDADTGGQIKYVIEMGQQLSMLKDVARVDLLTRLITDKTVSQDYAEPIEQVSDGFRIVRIQCGGRKYIRKELLWPLLEEYIDKTIKFIRNNGIIPDIVHGHYADAGYVAMQLSQFFGIPFIFTGHSLGRAKQKKLLQDAMKPDDIIKKFRIDHRIKTEEEVLKTADLVVTSTNQEITGQYGMYDNHDLPRFQVIPPGVDVEKFYPYYHDQLPEQRQDEETMYAHVCVTDELDRFFMYPDKPLILTLCRPEKRKNISGLIKAYGEDPELQTMANLAIFAGIRKDIADKEENERDVLTEMLLMMDKYDLYGRMAIPKKHNFEHEVPELYRIAAGKKGVFVNAALTEPFGLTLIEASSCGIPIVSTDDGGPRDIIDNCKNGLLVDTTDTVAISTAIKKIISHPDTWKKYSRDGIVNVRKHYTWQTHVKRYLQEIKGILKTRENESESFAPAVPGDRIGRRMAGLNYFLITDIDNTLIGADNKALAELLDILEKNRDNIGFGVATGRNIDSAMEILAKHGVPMPDILIASVGAEIYYGRQQFYGKGWDAHIASKWNREKICSLLEQYAFLSPQEVSAQRTFKISYNMEPGKDRLSMIHDLLIKNKCKYNMIYSHNKYLDILPYRASKGKAIRYLSYKWEIPLENIMVCGDSGNDEEMLRGEPYAVVVGNYSPEIEGLKGQRRIYFSQKEYAAGIVDAMEHYKVLEKIHCPA
ncbi:MAG: HAD-IIB family hydrolase [Thermodesulfobacteriota bacterium]|nr:HAD-IIB family hydrolase [Thermodesulfobacteriota bacterium]